MRIGLSYDLKDAMPVGPADIDDALEEYDTSETVELIAAAFEEKGHSVVMLGGGSTFLNNILRENIDFVFNIAEGRGNYRSREAQIPAILEMLNIPYSGSDPHCLAICLDKPLTKNLVKTAGILTPRWLVLHEREELRKITTNGFPFPAIVKPAYEGSSKGIRLDSVVNGPRQAKEVAEKLLEHYHQPVMLEEFIRGDEVTVGIIGNSPPKVLGLMRILPRRKEQFFVYSLEVKRDWEALVDYECPAFLEEKYLKDIEASSLNIFEALGCRDFARLDFRISSEGLSYFLEINPLPGLGTYSDLIIMAIKMGLNHQRLIGDVLDAALDRYTACVNV